MPNEFAKKQETYVYPAELLQHRRLGIGSQLWCRICLRTNRYEYRNNFAEVEARQAKVIADAEKDRQQVWDLLQGETASMRSQLSKKYDTPL